MSIAVRCVARIRHVQQVFCRKLPADGVQNGQASHTGVKDTDGGFAGKCSHGSVNGVWSSLEESTEECGRFIRDAHDLVRCLTIELEVELGLGSTVVPVGEEFELASSQAALRERGAPDGDADARRLPGDPEFPWTASAEVTMPLATRPGPPSFSLAKTKIMSPLAMCLPPYIVFCSLNANAFALGSLTSALIANILLSSRSRIEGNQPPPGRGRA